MTRDASVEPTMASSMTTTSSSDGLHGDVAAAVAGDADALERVARAVNPLIHRLALRFFGCPHHAADATQEALVQIVTRLDRFAGESAFTTWVYRVATNKFLSMARSPVEREVSGIDEFVRDLDDEGAGLAADAPDVDRALLLEEVRIGCTLAMLACLDRPGRMAYILGAIAELDHETAAEILDCAPATYRKRLQRARETITGLMRARCGVFDPANACECDRRVPVAIGRGRLDPHALVFASSAEQARRFPEVLHHIRRLHDVERAAAIYRSHPEPVDRGDVVRRLRQIVADVAGVSVDQG
jgi:RNA polymerase sigma factor (sigma-70 family)